jgi:hypothetical protein
MIRLMGYLMHDELVMDRLELCRLLPQP